MSLRQGSIVWIELPDPQGRNPKTRPGVVITPTEEIAAGGLVTLVALTSRASEVPSAEAVAVPWHAAGHPRTRLRRPGVAACRWRFTHPVDELPAPEGYVPDGPLADIVRLAVRLVTSVPAVPSPAPSPETPPAE